MINVSFPATSLWMTLLLTRESGLKSAPEYNRDEARRLRVVSQATPGIDGGEDAVVLFGFLNKDLNL